MVEIGLLDLTKIGGPPNPQLATALIMYFNLSNIISIEYPKIITGLRISHFNIKRKYLYFQLKKINLADLVVVYLTLNQNTHVLEVLLCYMQHYTKVEV